MRLTSRWTKSVPSWTRNPTSATCLWSHMWTTASRPWRTRWCPKLASLRRRAPERPALQTRAKTSRSAALQSNQRKQHINTHGGRRSINIPLYRVTGLLWGVITHLATKLPRDLKASVSVYSSTKQLPIEVLWEALPTLCIFQILVTFLNTFSCQYFVYIKSRICI